MWIQAAIASAAILGFVNIIDSHLVARRMPSMHSYLMPLGVVYLLIGTAFLTLFPMPAAIPAGFYAVAVGSSAARAIAVYLMLRAMRSGEVSRIIPVTNTFPIFVALMAVPLLGESLGYVEWLGIIITVAGAMFISLRVHTAGERLRLDGSFAMPLGASLLFGISNIASKQAMSAISFLNMYAINVFCMGVIFIAIAMRPPAVRELQGMKKPVASLILLAANEGVALCATVLSFWAIGQGPVSLVSTVLSIRPLFVFAYALAVSWAFPQVITEPLDRGVIATKLISIALIVSGVAILTMKG